jgi:recombination protein RecA
VSKRKGPPKVKTIASGTPSAEAASTILQAALAAINKKYGQDTVGDWNASVGLADERQLLTGSLALNIAIGPIRRHPNGLWQAGYKPGFVEMFGAESSGKSTLLLIAIARAQDAGITCALIDAEHSFDPVYAANLGVIVKDLLYIKAPNGTAALEILDTLVKSGRVGLIGVDSVASLVPEGDMESEIGHSRVGSLPGLLSDSLKRIIVNVAHAGTTVIFINQIREKIGVVYGNPEVTPGGRALKFYSHLRLHVSRAEWVTEGDVRIGHRIRVKCVKNKWGLPHRQAEFNFLWPNGLRKGCIDNALELLEAGILFGLITANGSWYSIAGQSIGQGKDTAVATIRANPSLLYWIYNEVMTMVQAATGRNPDGTPIPGFEFGANVTVVDPFGVPPEGVLQEAAEEYEPAAVPTQEAA